jgi:hypothetical protein
VVAKRRLGIEPGLFRGGFVSRSFTRHDGGVFGGECLVALPRFLLDALILLVARLFNPHFSTAGGMTSMLLWLSVIGVVVAQGSSNGGGVARALSFCTQGCSSIPATCACLDPVFTCNPKAGIGGTCQMAWWLILIIVLVVVAIGVAIFFCARCCCCPTCCTRKQQTVNNHIYGALPQDHMLKEHLIHSK